MANVKPERVPEKIMTRVAIVEGSNPQGATSYFSIRLYALIRIPAVVLSELSGVNSVTELWKFACNLEYSWKFADVTPFPFPRCFLRAVYIWNWVFTPSLTHFTIFRDVSLGSRRKADTSIPILTRQFVLPKLWIGVRYVCIKVSGYS
jgi:hypothetical protein